MRSKKRTAGTSGGVLSQSIQNLPHQPKLCASCYEGESLFHFLKSIQREIESARALDATLPPKFWTKDAKESTNNSISKPIASNKTSLKGRDQKLSLRESTRNNIVSNVSSFVPLVQQKQAAATACAGKRDVKVKALEAAEAAKRLEEKKENERKLRKEAMKVERAKLEEKNLRQMELEKKKKEEERKKKDADIIAKKRLREEEERKDKEKKRMRPDTKQRQRENEERKRAEKAEKEKDNHRSKDQQTNSKESHDEPKKQQSENTREDGVALQKAETKSTLTAVVTNHGECSTSVITGEVEKAMHSVDKSPRKEDLITQNNQVKSYEISPYQCSDDEDEEDDALPAKKLIPSWASKNSVAMFLPLQQKLDPDVIFPLESFCNMDEVLLPRKLQQSQVAT